MSSATGAVAGAALDEVASKQLLARHGVPVPESVMVRPGDPLDAALAALAPPFALKVVARGLLHKSDLGGVALNLRDANEVADAMRKMRSSSAFAGHPIEGFLVEEMAARGHELVVGGAFDRSFGPTIMLGLGGIFVEIFADVAFRICPITRADAIDMVESLVAAPVLRGARGGVVAAIEPLIDVLLRVGGEGGLLMDDAARVAQLDINPLIVTDRAALAVDARVILR